jgi:hypothetical protein
MIGRIIRSRNEALAFFQEVAGSIPAALTNKIKYLY